MDLRRAGRAALGPIRRDDFEDGILGVPELCPVDLRRAGAAALGPIRRDDLEDGIVGVP